MVNRKINIWGDDEMIKESLLLFIGTATGALSLQVNTANGEVKKTITLWQNYYPEGQWGWIVVFCALVVQAINHGAQLGVSTLLVKVDRRFHVGEPALLGKSITK
jgi:hypothetical protein